VRMLLEKNLGEKKVFLPKFQIIYHYQIATTEIVVVNILSFSKV
jgi:hypothetical protein